MTRRTPSSRKQRQLPFTVTPGNLFRYLQLRRPISTGRLFFSCARKPRLPTFTYPGAVSCRPASKRCSKELLAVTHAPPPNTCHVRVGRPTRWRWRRRSSALDASGGVAVLPGRGLPPHIALHVHGVYRQSLHVGHAILPFGGRLFRAYTTRGDYMHSNNSCFTPGSRPGFFSYGSGKCDAVIASGARVPTNLSTGQNRSE